MINVYNTYLPQDCLNSFYKWIDGTGLSYFAIKSIPSTYRRDYGAVLITVCFEFWKR